MKETRAIMGMPITVEIADANATQEALDRVFAYFTYVDETFSTFKETSEITKINNGLLGAEKYSDDMREVLALSEKTRHETDGYFDIKKPDGKIDPSGLVKGWAIFNAAKLLKGSGFENFYIDAGGDIQPFGHNAKGEPWLLGIREPVDGSERVVKTLVIGGNEGVATSGTYVRGQHIFNPKVPGQTITEIVSLTVIGPNVYEADRFATAAFAMGKKGIAFIERLPGFEGYLIDADNMATMTNGFIRYAKKYV